MCDNIGQDNKG